MEMDNSLDTDFDVSSADETAPVAKKNSSRSKKNLVKVPRKINKARREKLKREQFNDLFLGLAKALAIKEPNNGKAMILTEAARFLSGMIAHVDRLREENKTLTAECQYVTVEKDELIDDNSTLSSEVDKLKGEIDSRRSQSQPNHNVHPPQHVPIAPQQLQLLSKDLGFPVLDTSLAIPHPPCPPFLVFQSPSTNHPLPNQTSIVRKPCPRYPDHTGSWQSRILEEQLKAGNTN